MIGRLKEEIIELYRFLERNRDVAVITLAATLFLTLEKYHPIGPDWLSQFVYFAVLPLLVIVVVLRKNPLDFGLRPGQPRLWGLHVLVICVTAALILYVSSFFGPLQEYYVHEGFNFWVYFLTSCVILSAWEFLYRGFLLFGLRERFGEGSIFLQMIPFVILHFGKPEVETISTLLTGVLFGYVAYRGRSYWPAFIIHLFINLFFVGLVNLKG